MSNTLRTLNQQSWDDRLEARAHTYQLRGRFKFAHDRLVLHQPKRWLDIGTGNGFLPRVTRPSLNGVHITGTDFAENALAAAADALDDHKLADLDAQGLPFANESFDFITCLEVIEHLILPEQALSEMHRVLKPGGRVTITVPNLQHVEYLGQLIRGKLPGPAADARHMSVFTHHFLGQMMNRTGFTLTHRSGCDASPAWFAHISPRYLCKTIAVEGIKR